MFSGREPTLGSLPLTSLRTPLKRESVHVSCSFPIDWSLTGRLDSCQYAASIVIHPACGGDLMPAGSGFVPGRMPFPMRKYPRWKPRGTDGIVVKVPRSVVKYSNSGRNLQMMAIK